MGCPTYVSCPGVAAAVRTVPHSDVLIDPSHIKLLRLVLLILFDISTTFIKLSMLAMIYRLTTASQARWMSVLVRCLAIVVGLNGVIFTIVMLLQCR